MWICVQSCFDGYEKVQKVYHQRLNRVSSLQRTPLASRTRKRRKRGGEKHLSKENRGEAKERYTFLNKIFPYINVKGGIFFQPQRETKKRNTHFAIIAHNNNNIITRNINIISKMVFATKLQINAFFKKAAPAKKTVAPAKKVRF